MEYEMLINSSEFSFSDILLFNFVVGVCYYSVLIEIGLLR